MNSLEHREWLEKLMKDHGLNKKRWAERAGLSTPNILYNYFKGRSDRLDEDTRRLLAPLVGLTSEQMQAGPQGAAATRLLPGQLSSLAQPLPARAHADFVPVYGPAAAGSPDLILLTEDFVVGRKPTPEELLDVRGGFVMYIAGNSMRPRYKPGDKVSVHPYKRPGIEQDCVLVMAEDGNALVKEFRGETKTEWLLWEHHPHPGKPLKIKKSKVRGLYAVVGRPS